MLKMIQRLIYHLVSEMVATMTTMVAAAAPLIKEEKNNEKKILSTDACVHFEYTRINGFRSPYFCCCRFSVFFFVLSLLLFRTHFGLNVYYNAIAAYKVEWFSIMFVHVCT